MRYYRLNFKGFGDTRKELFGDTIIESLYNIDINEARNVLDTCIATVKNKLNVNLPSIDEIQFMQQSNYAAQLLVTGQNEYLLLLNLKMLQDQNDLISAIYHELCHAYQLNKLFNEKVIFYDYNINDIDAQEQTKDEAMTHLNTNNGHTKYWQELADLINNIIKPIKQITAYYTEAVNNLRAELTENYISLNFSGFYDTLTDLFGKKGD